ncbi:antibiotic biosynthesis monooxygenase family protein [Salipiger mangrovisoli]|uniref:Antibiotic biosynthesis monooxygenase n=1 Tax=Salipiger mangrovisoli TaxID=2865933 RepID=A0ABR9X8A6_9RHOB|nr:antibiotic biosynthesis monooxygenase family protein [Salipiger mangrovisoli]MBE9639753.1 antibiotic biosynthesis monooxygenase [Salipiger mangrovisoli]
MTVEYIRYSVPSAQQEAFLRDYAAARVPLLRSPYARDFEISQCDEDPSQFILRILWTSAEDHMEKFRGSAEFREFFGHIRPYLGMIEEMRHYTPR